VRVSVLLITLQSASQYGLLLTMRRPKRSLRRRHDDVIPYACCVAVCGERAIKCDNPQRVVVPLVKSVVGGLSASIRRQADRHVSVAQALLFRLAILHPLFRSLAIVVAECISQPTRLNGCSLMNLFVGRMKSSLAAVRALVYVPLNQASRLPVLAR
jgi:hypothetical protein